MQHNIREAGTLTYVLEIKASANDLVLDVQQAVRKKRSESHLKGFRPGRVPHHWIRRMFKRELEEEVTKTLIEEAYEDLVAQSGQYDVIGDPRRITYSYELDGDLHVELEFATQPEFELHEVEEQVLEVPHIAVTDGLVEATVHWLRQKNVFMRPLTEDETIGEEGLGELDAVVCEATEVDPATGVILIGASGNKMEVELGEPAYEDDPEYQALCEALTGRQVGESVLVKFTETPEAIVLDSEPEERAYRAVIIEVKRRQVPEIDDKFVNKLTFEQVVSAEEWPSAVRKLVELLTHVWNNRSRDEAIEERIVEIQAVPVPEGLVRKNLEEYREMARASQSGESDRADYFRQRLAWHYIEEQLHAQGLFKWPVEQENDWEFSDQEVEIIRELEDVFGSESHYASAPRRRRCALDYLETQFDVIQVEDDNVDYLGPVFAEAAIKLWLSRAYQKASARGG